MIATLISPSESYFANTRTGKSDSTDYSAVLIEALDLGQETVSGAHTYIRASRRAHWQFAER